MSLKDIVADYIKNKRKVVEAERRFYAEKTSFQEVVSLAAKAKGPCNGIHPHQRRVGAKRLSEFAKSLLEALPDLKKLKSFEELYNAVEARKIEGVGELTVYDTALRIGWYLKIEPEKVYLHCGAKKGAKNLGVGEGEKTISADKFPSDFHKFKPYEIEDCLCIYKDSLLLLSQKK